MSACGCANAYNYGTQIQLSVAFVNAVTGAPADPTDVELAIQFGGYPASGFYYSSGAVQKAAVGSYYMNYTPASGGWYTYAFKGTGALIAATGNNTFQVTDNLFG